MASVVQKTLRELCHDTGIWCYAVFWKLKRQMRTVLTWEDGFHEPIKSQAGLSPGELTQLNDRIGLAVARMAYHVYSVGEGTIGRVAFTNKHQWIFSETNRKVILGGSFGSKGYAPIQAEYPRGWEDQFSAGIKTIAIIAVPQGVVQLGSIQTVLEDAKLIRHVKALFGSLQSTPLLDLISEPPREGLHVSYSTTLPLSQLPVINSDALATTTISLPVIPDICGVAATTQQCSQRDEIGGLKPSQHLHSSSQNISVGIFRPISMPQPAYMQAMEPHELYSLPASAELLAPQRHSMQSHCSEVIKRSQTGVSMTPLDSPSSSGTITQLALAGKSSRRSTWSPTDSALQIKLHHSQKIQNVDQFMPLSKHSSESSNICSVSNGISPCNSIPKTCSQDVSASTADNIHFDLLQLVQQPKHRGNDTCRDLISGTGGDRDSLSVLNDLPLAPVVENSSSVGFTSIQNDFISELDDFDEFITSIIRGPDKCNGTSHGAKTTVSLDYSDSVPLIEQESPLVMTGSLQSLPVREDTGTNLPVASMHCYKKTINSGQEVHAKFQRPTFWDQTTNQNSFQIECMNKPNGTSNIDIEWVRGAKAPKVEHPHGRWVEAQARQETLFTSANQHEETSKSGRKRARPGENARPRPKDRQQIQDRVHELRELIPSSTKCSIDALLEKTIKYMNYLQTVTQEANDWKKTGKLQEGSERTGSMDATWAVDFGGQGRGCPIVVENLSQPRHFLIEMLCEDKGIFLEIADSVRGLNLAILKGVMEVRDKKIWAQFVVKAVCDIHRVEVLWPLMQLLDSNMRASSDITNPQSS